VRRTVLAALALVAAPLAAGCSSEPTCDDVGTLQAQLEDTEVDDPDYNTINNDLAQARADCNR
jgi:hypothetical protein